MAVEWSNFPNGTAEVVLDTEDPDAPRLVLPMHLVATGISPDTYCRRCGAPTATTALLPSFQRSSSNSGGIGFLNVHFAIYFFKSLAGQLGQKLRFSKRLYLGLLLLLLLPELMLYLHL